MICMSKFIVKPDFWAVFPHASIAVVLAKGVDNAAACPEAEALLESAHRGGRKIPWRGCLCRKPRSSRVARGLPPVQDEKGRALLY